MTELADALDIDQFSVLGVSGGGPYVAACARKIPYRLKSAGIVSGLGPINAASVFREMLWFNRVGLKIANRLPSVTKPIVWTVAFLLRHHAELIVHYLTRRVKDPDRMVLKKTHINAIMTATFKESMCRGSAGAARDVILYASPWGFDLQDIQMQIHLWHGEKDAIIPISMGRFMAEMIPNCRATFYREQGHFSLVFIYLEEILQKLTG